MIQLESFNTFLINLIVENPNTGETYEITPFINSLANNSQNLYYYNFFSNIGVGKTSDAEFAALTGIFQMVISLLIMITFTKIMKHYQNCLVPKVMKLTL